VSPSPWEIFINAASLPVSDGLPAFTLLAVAI
jgi:hypothetical protein